VREVVIVMEAAVAEEVVDKSASPTSGTDMSMNLMESVPIMGTSIPTLALIIYFFFFLSSCHC
jgi:hypothetical protein